MDGDAVRHSAEILNAISVAWGEVRARHEEVPVVTAMFGSATRDAQSCAATAHFRAERYVDGSDELVNELFVSVEGLANGPINVLGYLIHAGAHGISFAREVQDTSNRGRYHNKHFVTVAKSMGLDVKKGADIGAFKNAKYGWFDTSIPERTVGRYGAAIEALEEACRLWRLADPEEERKQSEPSVPMVCGCGRRLSIPMKQAKASPFRCNGCQSLMLPSSDWLAGKGLTSWKWEYFGPEVTITLTEEMYFEWRADLAVPPSFSDPDGPWLYAGDEKKLTAQESMFDVETIDKGQLPCLRCRKPVINPIELRRQRERAERLGIERTWSSYCGCPRLT